MKKILFSIFTLALATMVGCQKSDIDDTQNNPTNSESKITVTANIVSDGQTRVALTPETDGEDKPVVKVDWKNSGEAFNVYGTQDDPIKVHGPETFTQSEGSLFSGNNPYQHSPYYYATYPASNLITVQIVADEVSIIFDKSNFTSQNGKLSEDRTLMWATVSYIDENTQFNFEHLTSLLMPKFRIVGESENLSADKIASITFKNMLVPEGPADFNIDCTSHTAEDNIYVYIPETESNYNTIEVIVTTDDEKVFDGEISIGGTAIEPGKLYTANIWLTKETTISYTTTNNEELKLNNVSFKEHNFEDGVGTIVLKGTTVPDDAFASQTTLQTITLSSEITKIGARAFQSCSALTTVTMPGVTEIGAGAFKSCGALTTVTMPGVTEIGEEAFNMENLDNSTQVLNNKLSNIDLSKVQKFGQKALYKVALREINLNSATEIGAKAFAEMYYLESVTMPEQDCKIGKQSFAACKKLTTIDLTNVNNIGEKAFENCTELKTVFIDRASIPTVGNIPFNGCTGGLMIFVPDNLIDQYAQINSLSAYIVRTAITYTTTDNTILTLISNAWGEGDNCVYSAHVFVNGVGKIVLRDGVTTLPANAFAEQYTLKSFVLPMCITTVGNSAFQKCCYLESIEMPNVTVIGARAFCMSGCNDILDKLKIKHLDLSNVREIGEEAFRIAASITSIDVSTATNIGARAFFELGKLTSVTMPAKGSNCVLGEAVFGYSNSFTKIDLSGVERMGAMQFEAWYSYNPITIIIDREIPPKIVPNGNNKQLWNVENNHANPTIYVPKDFVETYKQHEDWSQYANNIKPIS